MYWMSILFNIYIRITHKSWRTVLNGIYAWITLALRESGEREWGERERERERERTIIWVVAVSVLYSYANML